MNSSSHLQFTVQFPLPDGRTLVQGPLTYNKDKLATSVNSDFISEPLFAESYRLGRSTLDFLDEQHRKIFTYGEWRVYVACWAANQAKHLPGDFVECGVNTGFLSRAIINYVNFSELPKKFYLFDTFCGIPEEQISTNEKSLNFESTNKQYYTTDIYDKVLENFQEFRNVELIKGKVPDTLIQAPLNQVSYLSIDMNCAYPEVAAMEYFWDMLVPGAIVVFDDYGFSTNGGGHITQKIALDKFARSKKTQILQIPTGQGLLVKNILNENKFINF